MVVEINEEGFDELADRMSRADMFAMESMRGSLRKIGRLFVPKAHSYSGPLAEETPRRTGKLARSTWFDVKDFRKGETHLEIYQSAKTPSGKFYGYWVREGTPPHDIFPKQVKALKFEMDGNIIFAKHVKHPGSKANPYHRRVFQRLLPNVNGIIKEMGGFMTAYLSGEGEKL